MIHTALNDASNVYMSRHTHTHTMSCFWLVNRYTSVSQYDWEQRIRGGGRYFYDTSELLRVYCYMGM